MIRLQIQLELGYQVMAGPADFLLNVLPARTHAQAVVAERVRIETAEAAAGAADGFAPARPLGWQEHRDPMTGCRLLRLRAPTGRLSISTTSTVDIRHRRRAAADVAECSLERLPADVLVYLMPSRYCESDRLLAFAFAEFGHGPRGHARAAAICDWVSRRIRYRPGASTPQTTATDTLAAGVGVCRDYAHLMIALCRAMNLPARFVSGTDYGTDPALGPPDFHAYVEVWLDDGWYLFDPTGLGIPMGYARIGTGRDAAEAAFATIFGAVRSGAPVVRTVAIHDPAAGIALPVPCDDALSTDGAADRVGPWVAAPRSLPSTPQAMRAVTRPSASRGAPLPC